MNNSYITIIKEKRTVLSRKRVPLNQNECTADFRIGVPFEQNLHTEIEIAENLFRLTVTDNGKGYPPEVLATLHSDETPDNTPHILGLHVVEQIATAHGGKTLFCQNVPAGAKAVVWLPVE